MGSHISASGAISAYQEHVYGLECQPTSIDS